MLEQVKIQISNGTLWENLLHSHEAGHMLAAGSPSGSDSNVSSQGIVFGHAYAILRVVAVDGHRLMQLRNPWGDTEWKGDWSDDSRKWTTRLKRKMGMVANKDDGSFWMSFEDFTIAFYRPAAVMCAGAVRWRVRCAVRERSMSVRGVEQDAMQDLAMETRGDSGCGCAGLAIAQGVQDAHVQFVDVPQAAHHGPAAARCR